MEPGKLSSSPLTPPPSSHSQQQSASGNDTNRYRSVQDLPFELTQHIQTYFEESLFTQGFNFLFSIVSASASGPASRPITVPSPEYLAVAATIAIHPSFTTRTRTQDKHEQSAAALKLLRFINQVVGPVNAQIGFAFVFRRYDGRSKARNQEDKDSPFEQKLTISYADDESVFASAEDFWNIVGWALNCSCLSGMYSRRWDYWSEWLDFMLDVLQRDWVLHKQQNPDSCQESLLWQYITSSAGSGASGRRILRAIFADSSTQALNEFREVFHKELKKPKKEDNNVKRREVNVDIDEEIYGDYLEQEDSEYSSDNEDKVGGRKRTTTHEDLLIAANSLQPRPSKRLRRRTPSAKAKKIKSTTDTPTDASSDDEEVGLGSPNSIQIRLRLLKLLLEVSSHPTLLHRPKNRHTFLHLEDLYTLLISFIKPLPLSTFQQFILPSIHTNLSKTTSTRSFDNGTNKLFSNENLTTLQEFLIQRLIESSAPSIGGILGDPKHNIAPRPLTQDILTTHYLPFAAAAGTGNSGARSDSGDRSNKNKGATGIVDAQARISLVLEGMLRILALQGSLREPTDDNDQESLSDVVERGIRKRLKKAEDGMNTLSRDSDGRGRRSEKTVMQQRTTVRNSPGGEKMEGEEGIDIAWRVLVESGDRMKAVVSQLSHGS